MSNSSSEFKRRFPRWNRCCCCFPLKTGVIVVTILFLLYDIYGLYRSYWYISNGVIQYLDTLTIAGYVAEVIVILILLVFLIGIFTNKLFLMKFIYGFAAYLLYDVVGLILVIFKLKGGEYRKELIDEYKKSNSKVVEKDIDRAISFTIYGAVVGFVIRFSLYLYYFIACCVCIEDIEENEYEEKKIRYSEENEY